MQFLLNGHYKIFALVTKRLGNFFLFYYNYQYSKDVNKKSLLLINKFIKLNFNFNELIIYK